MKYIRKRNEPKGRDLYRSGFAPDIGSQIISLPYDENVILPKISVAKHGVQGL